MSSINLLRLNCLLTDRTLNGFRNVILSLLCEYLYDNENKEVTVQDCFNFIVDQKSIVITYEVFNSYITESNNFSLSGSNNHTGVKLKDEKYLEIDRKIKEESLESHIKTFITTRKLGDDKSAIIRDILYHSIYLNVMSFDINNIQSIVPIDVKKKYEEEEIKLFNSFLDYDDVKKNNALFRVFLNAVEYAIITSGKGINEYVSHIFKEKTYYLDTNIILRLLGIGGEERKKGLLKLFDICHKQGVKFRITKYTYTELNDIIDAKISLLSSSNVNAGSVELVGELIEEEKGFSFNQDFFTHFISVKRNKNTVTDLESYRLDIKLDLAVLKKKYSIGIEYRINFDEKIIEKAAILLLQEKKLLRSWSRYTKTAAKIDAANILFVRQKRDGNNYNFQDIKEFYLTTDGILNQILQKKDNLLSETILPSQLFILHNGLFAENDEIDYDLFVGFLKKRTTEFQLSGKEVLKYIDTIRKYTSDTVDTKAILEVFIEQRYEFSKSNIATEDDEIKALNDVAKTYLEKKITSQGEIIDKHNEIFDNACANLPLLYKKARILGMCIEYGIILLIAVALFLLGGFKFSIYTSLVLLIITESAKHFLKDRFNFFKTIVKNIYMKQVKSGEYYRFSKQDIFYLRKAEELIK